MYKEKNDYLGTTVRLVVEGMSYQIREAIERREGDILKVIEERINERLVAEEIIKEIDQEINARLSVYVGNGLQNAVAEEVMQNKEIKKKIIESVERNKTAIAEAIYQRYMK